MHHIVFTGYIGNRGVHDQGVHGRKGRIGVRWVHIGEIVDGLFTRDNMEIRVETMCCIEHKFYREKQHKSLHHKFFVMNVVDGPKHGEIYVLATFITVVLMFVLVKKGVENQAFNDNAVQGQAYNGYVLYNDYNCTYNGTPGTQVTLYNLVDPMCDTSGRPVIIWYFGATLVGLFGYIACCLLAHRPNHVNDQEEEEDD